MIPGHSYSIEDFEVIKGTKIIKLRNPWGEGEWLGEWSDAWIKNKKSEFDEKQFDRLKQDFGNDGTFWMNWNEFVKEFENITVCHLPEQTEYEMRARGIFRYSC